jgi:hypothetical protein
VLVEVDRHLVPLDAPKERFRDDQRRCKYLADDLRGSRSRPASLTCVITSGRYATA